MTDYYSMCVHACMVCHLPMSVSQPKVNVISNSKILQKPLTLMIHDGTRSQHKSSFSHQSKLSIVIFGGSGRVTQVLVFPSASRKRRQLLLAATLLGINVLKTKRMIEKKAFCKCISQFVYIINTNNTLFRCTPS